MGLAYVIGIVLAILSIRTRVPRTPSEPLAGPVATLAVAALAAGLVLALGAELRVLDDAAATQRMPAWQVALPLQVFAGNGSAALRDSAGIGSIVAALGVVQATLSLGLWYVLRRVRLPAPAIVGVVLVGAFLMAWEAFAAHLAGPDVFAYVGFGLVANPYHPIHSIHSILAPSDVAVWRIWGGKLPPSPYGPVWNAVCRGIVALDPALGARLWLFRSIGCVAMCATIAALAAFRQPVTAALVALNPTLWHLYVAEAHNDIVAIALVLAAVSLRRYPVLAVVLVALASAVKLPFLAIGLVAFCGRETLRERLLPALAAVLAGSAIALRFGGADYLWALRRTAELYAHHLSSTEVAAHALLAVTGLLALGVGFVARRFFWGADWAPVAFGQYTAWQYLGWGLPYAVLDETNGALYLAVLPISAFEVTLIFNGDPLYLVSRVAACAGGLAILVSSLVRRSRAARRALPARAHAA